MILMDITDLDRDSAHHRNAADVHAPRWLRSPSSNAIIGPSNLLITLSKQA
jgi:hypothetical protein